MEHYPILRRLYGLFDLLEAVVVLVVHARRNETEVVLQLLHLVLVKFQRLVVVLFKLLRFHA